MKTAKIICVLFFFAGSLYSQQPFAPPGAVWHYDFAAVASGGFLKIEYHSDSLVQNILCKKLESTLYRWFATGPGTIGLDISQLSPRFVYQNADTVFWFTQNRFRELYNFNAATGSTWTVTDSMSNGMGVGGCDSLSDVAVDSAGLDTINSMILCYLSVHPANGSPLGFIGRIYERIGSMNILFPEYAYCDSGIIVDAPFYKLHCYQDDNFPLYNADTSDCEAFWWTLNASEIYSAKEMISIYPNPSNDFISLDISDDIKYFTIENSAGRLVLKQDCVRIKKFRVDLNSYSSGVYFIKAIGSSGVLTKKFVRL